MKKTLVFIAMLLTVASLAHANGAGTTGFELFRTDCWARNCALGGSQIAVGGGLHSQFTNPAGLADVEEPTGSIGFFKHVLDINAGNAAYAHPLKNVGIVALGITYLDYGSFDRADEHGYKNGTFGASDVLITASAARYLRPHVAGGVSLKFLNSTIDSYSASALAADVGVLYHTGYYGWDIGAGVFNVGFATSAYLTQKDKLPTSYRLGLSVPLEHLPVRFSAAGEFTDAEGIRGLGGLELTLSQYVQARIGYNTVGIDQRVGLSSDALAGFSAGLGIHIRRVSFDYALTSQGEVGYLHRVTLSSSFPGFGNH
jgi:hypothetical protein